MVPTGVIIPSEGKTKDKIKDLLPPIECKMTPAKVSSNVSTSVKGLTTKTIPMAYISNLPEFIDDYLNRLDK